MNVFDLAFFFGFTLLVIFMFVIVPCMSFLSIFFSVHA